MKLFLILSLIFVTLNVIHSMKLLSSSSRTLNRRERKLVKRLVKRQTFNDVNCNRQECSPINCGKDFVAASLPGECCEKCVPWEYASSLGIQYPQAPPSIPIETFDQRRQASYSSNVYPTQRVDVYIFGPEDGARVATGQSIYFDCEIVSPYNQYAQPRWSRTANQPLPYKVQTTILPGNRKLARLTIPDATQSDGGRYECSAGTGNPNDLASIDLQVIDSGYYPRPVVPQYPSYPSYNSYNPYPSAATIPPAQPQPQPQPGLNIIDEEGDDIEDEDDPSDSPNESTTTTTSTPPTTSAVRPSPSENLDENLNEDEGEYPEDYTENE